MSVVEEPVEDGIVEGGVADDVVPVVDGDLASTLDEAEAAGRLNQRLKTLTHPVLPVVDEIGYLPVARSGAILFFQLINGRYEHAPTVLTSNQGFERWGEILTPRSSRPRCSTGCHIVNICGNSYHQLRRHMELRKAVHPTASRAVSAEHARSEEMGS